MGSAGIRLVFSKAASHFTGPREHRQVPLAGHNLPAEAPQAFAAAVLDVAAVDVASPH